MVTSETSEKYVPSPQWDTVLGDLLIGLKRFKNVTRWKEFFLKEHDNKNEEVETEEDNHTEDSSVSTE
jgi:hypothetical protein